MAGWFGVRRKLLEWSKVWGAKKVRALRRYIFSNRIRILKTSIFLQTLKTEFKFESTPPPIKCLYQRFLKQQTNVWGSNLLWVQTAEWCKWLWSKSPNVLLAQRSFDQILVGPKVLLVQAGVVKMRLAQFGSAVLHFNKLTKVSYWRNQGEVGEETEEK